MIKKSKGLDSLESVKSAVDAPVGPSSEDLEAKRNELINSVKPLLVTKRQMVEGGRLVRSKVSQEQAYLPIIQEINQIGLKLGYGEVSIGSLRRD